MKKLLYILLCLLAINHVLFAAEVRISGVGKSQQERYLNRLEPRLQYIKSRPASSWRADDASFFLQRLFIRDGYPLAEVNWEIQGRTIILNVNSGQRFLYGSVNSFQQTSLDEETLINYFYQPLVEGELVSIKKAPYIREYSQQGAENLENYLKSKGYWEAQVNLFSEDLNPETARVDILLDIVEGSIHKLSIPKFEGISSEDRQALLADISKTIGEIASSANINAITSAVTSYFRSNGFHFALIETSTQHENNETTLFFTVEKGQRYEVDDIIVRGNSTTQSKRIARHFDKLKGENYDADAADKSTRKLLKSGVFKTVIVTPLPRDNGKLDLDIEVKEGKTVTTKIYLGADSYEGPIFGLSYTDLNLAGKMWKLNARGEFSGRGLLGEVGITEPFFAGENITFNTRLFALSRTPDGYGSHEFGLDSSWEWFANENYSMRLFTAGSVVSTSSSSITDAELGATNYLNLRVGLTQHLDLRNDPLLPFKGYNGKLKTEYSTIEGNDSSSYFKAEINNSYRQPVDSNSYLISRFDAGIISSSNPTTLPIDRRFFNGGSNTMRSFQERGLGPRSGGGDPLGGESYWIGSLEYVRKVKGPFHLATFYDLGQVYPAGNNFSFDSPSQAIGIGARIHLPIGPVRLEYGYNLNRKQHEPAGTFHFTIGASF